MIKLCQPLIRPSGAQIGFLLGIGLLVGLGFGIVVPGWADRDEVILTFEAVNIEGGPAGARLRISRSSANDVVLRPGQHATVAEGEDVTLTLIPDTGFAFRRWEGAFTAAEARVTYTFFGDSIIRAVVHRGDAAESDDNSKSNKNQHGSNAGRGNMNSGTGRGIGGINGPLEAESAAKTPAIIWVDFDYIGVELGTITNPFNTLAEGVVVGETLGSIAEPSTIKIQPGFSPEIIRIDPATPLRIEAPNGRARVGVTTGFVVTISTTGSGTVSGAGAYAAGATAVLTPTPVTNWAYSHWLGDLTGFDNPASLMMDSDKAVTAVFVEFPASLEITSATLTGGAPLPTQAVAGDTFTIHWNVTNSSGNAASSGDGNWTDNVFLSRDSAIGGDDKGLNATGTTVTGPVSGSGTYMASVEITIPDVSPGAYYLLVRTDTGDETTQTAASRGAGIFAHAITLSDPVLATP
ncbi:MAG: hypothetical protein SGI88_19525 [Candidatus Hydrogenedentes bacterium]|nr:hypothetical protein [Candidatus Hydrogenedentota bacterium]